MRIEANVGISLEDFIEQYHQAPFEWIDGERIALMPGVAEHGEIIKWLYRLLLNYESQHDTIAVYSEMPFVLTYDTDWVTGSRVPDLMVYNASRLAAYKQSEPEWRKKPFVLVPDLCIEVVSPNDKYIEVDEKVERYLSDGVKIIWVVNPRNTSVTVYSAEGDSIVKLNKEKLLQAEDILPGFSLRVGDIFQTL